MLALAGHAYEDQTEPFIMAAEILGEMIRLVPASDLRRMLGDDAAELSRLLTELRQRFADVAAPLDLPPEQRQLFKSVLEFLARTSGQVWMVMLLDDLQWADESSLLLLEHLAPRLPEMGLLPTRSEGGVVGPGACDTPESSSRRATPPSRGS